jgi:hypothetical protein
MGPKLYRELDRRGRIVRAAATAFTIYHLAAVLHGGAVPAVRKALKPVFGFYADGLRMTNSWGMFGKPPTTTNVTIEGDTKDKRGIVLSTTRAPDRTWFERIRDVRIRKIQSKLADDGDRARLGQAHLAYWCKHPPPGAGELVAVRAVNQIHELRDDEGTVTREASQRTVLTRRCTGPGGGPPPPLPAPTRPAPAPSPGGEGEL